MRLKLSIDILDVFASCLGRNPEISGDGRCDQPLGYPVQNRDFARTQWYTCILVVAFRLILMLGIGMESLTDRVQTSQDRPQMTSKIHFLLREILVESHDHQG